MKNWILASRPKTLTAALIPVVVGTSLAFHEGFTINYSLAIFALLSAFCIQIATNLVNDAKDFEKGTDDPDRIGPMRVTAAGIFSSKQVMLGAFIFFSLALAFAIPLIQSSGSVILCLGLASIICGYLYTGGPYPLAYLGLGELFVIIFFGLVAVGGVFFLQTRTWPATSVIAGLQIGFFSTLLIAINNLRDIHGDRKNDKKTLAVRFGQSFARAEITILIFSPYLLGIIWKDKSPWAFYLPLLSLPLAYLIDQRIHTTQPSHRFNSYLGQAALLHLLFGLLLSLGFVL